MTAPTANDTRTLADMPMLDSETLKSPYHFDKTLCETALVSRDTAVGRCAIGKAVRAVNM